MVLVVDDEPDLLELVSLTLSRMNLTTRTASDLNGARRLLKAERFDLCLTDMRLPDGDGLDLVAWIQENRAAVPVAVITAHGNIESAVRALKLGAFDFVSKPLDLGVLRKLVGSAIRLRAGADERRAATLHGPRLLGSSAVMEQLRDMIARVARSQAPVHICGESGTGKELVARMIHECGARHGDRPSWRRTAAPFRPGSWRARALRPQARQLQPTADKTRLIQSAEGSTLFLDEVADLPLHMQVKLLRVVQEEDRAPDRRGARRKRRCAHPVRRPTGLFDLVAQGLFREDLFYRINVIELRVPALRERSGDIAEIAQAILLRLSSRMNAAAPARCPPTLQTLKAYPFPGNVRELENILERAVTLSTGGVITPEHIRLRAGIRPLRRKRPRRQAGRSGAGGSQLEGIERDAASSRRSRRLAITRRRRRGWNELQRALPDQARIE